MTFIMMLHNRKLDRWHPILFRESPMPGPDAPGKPRRYKSIGHHTTGFPTKEEALRNIVDSDAAGNLRRNFGGEAVQATDEDIEWDGEDLPLQVGFAAADGKGLLFI